MQKHTMRALLLSCGLIATSPLMAGVPAAPSAPSAPVNMRPIVELLTPASGATANPPGSFALSASAYDPDGEVVSVKFMQGSTLLFSGSTEPYEYNWTGVAAGTYTLTAVATDDAGVSTTSAPVTVTVAPGSVPNMSVSDMSITEGNSGTKTLYYVVTLSAASSSTITFDASTANSSATAGSDYAAVSQTGVTIPAGQTTKTMAVTINGDTTVEPNEAFIFNISHAVGANITVGSAWGNILDDDNGGGGTSGSVTRTYVYDAYQRLCKTIDPEANASIVDYDAAGNVAWSAEGQPYTTSATNCDRTSVATGDKTTRTYDARNRLTQITTPGNAADIATEYYANGQVKKLTAANPGPSPVITDYTYNRRGLLTSETSSQPGWYADTIGYGYNANGHASSLTYPDMQVVDYAPDALGRPTKVGGYATGISYHRNGAIAGFTYGNGQVHVMVQNERQLPKQVTEQAGSVTAINDVYKYDPDGNVTGITGYAQAGLTTRFMTYDGLDRLLTANSPGQWGNATYSYDALDNLRSADIGGTAARQYRYNYDAKNLLSSIANAAGTTLFAFNYDARGNQTSKGGQAYQFDSANRLIEVTSKEDYRYDGLGRRVLAWSPGANMLWQYSQDGRELFASDGRRSQNRENIYLGNSVLATRTVDWGTGTVGVRYLHTDALGSPVAETSVPDPVTGVVTVLKRNSYEPYGVQYGTSTIDGIGYTGHVMDQATGLTYMQQRYYDPATGRFLSVDPIAANAGSFNRFWYANNNPYRFTDPDGRLPNLTDLTVKGLTTVAGAVGESADYLNDNIFIPMGPMAFEVSGPMEIVSMGAEALTAARGAGEVAEVAPKVEKVIELSTKAHGEAATHAAKAIRAGHPDVLTIARDGASSNRSAAIGGMQKVAGKQLDEYPPAMFKEGGVGASVKPINPSNNMSAGACIGNACRGLPNGAQVKIVVKED